MAAPYSRSQLAREFRYLPAVSIPSQRSLLRAINGVIRLHRATFRWPATVRATTHIVQGESGNSIPVLEVAPRSMNGRAPAVLDLHGGAYMFTYQRLHLGLAARYAVQARCRVFLPEYRRSLDQPFPASFDDCYSTLSWLHSPEGARLGVDRDTVVALGDSCGGALAAGVAQKALDESENPLCGQVLIYPVVDHEMKTESVQAFTNTPIWTTGSTRVMWQQYLGPESIANGGSRPVPPYAAPLHRDDFSGLPPALIEIAEFDPLRDEGQLYFEALRAAGVPAELRAAKGAPHEFEAAGKSAITEAMVAHRVETLLRFFGTR